MVGWIRQEQLSSVQWSKDPSVSFRLPPFLKIIFTNFVGLEMHKKIICELNLIYTVKKWNLFVEM